MTVSKDTDTPKVGDRVSIVAPHPWALHSGTFLGSLNVPNPGGYLVALDNGIRIRAERKNLRVS